METEGALVIDLRQPDWVDQAQARAATWAGDPPPAVMIDIDDAPAPSISGAQLIAMFAVQAARDGLPVTMRGQSAPVQDSLRRYGLQDVLPTSEGDLS